MPPFPKPSFDYDYDLDTQIETLRHHASSAVRDVPAKASDRLLLATWNIANLGVQERTSDDYAVIAEILSWFDIVAIQETNENLMGLKSIQTLLPNKYSVLFSDASGNDERLAFLFDTDKLSIFEEVGEVAFPPSQMRYVKLEGIEQRFDGFDRNPYLATFQAGSFVFSLVNCHSYFGSTSTQSINRRSLETYAIARWTEARHKSDHSITKDIIALGDLNLPKVEPGDPIYEALISRGLHIPDHSTEIGSSIASDNHYDQLAFFPGDTSDDFVQAGVFDFDSCLFRHLWETRSKEEFLAYMRYYVSDHRPLWAEFSLG